MGWKTSTILINPALPRIDDRMLLAQLGHPNVEPVGSHAVYESGMLPPEGTIWIGTHNDCLMIGGTDVAEQFFGRTTLFMLTLFKLFPQSEIAALALHSVVNYWGYAVFRGGKPIRLRRGSADTGTTDDVGDPLPEEAPILARSQREADGRRTYRFPEHPGEVFEEDQVGDSFVLAIHARLAGTRPDMEPSPPFAGYRLIRPWWKFW